ncbi:hypothetical protein [Pseudomonas kilonensis]|nr:hypothetical protein [Pseudomonas kilonensis]
MPLLRVQIEAHHPQATPAKRLGRRPGLQEVINRITQWSDTEMMTVYFVVMTICSGFEGCVDERQPGPTFASKAMCMETARVMAPRKGVKFKCRKERMLVVETPPVENYGKIVSTKTAGQP